MKNTKLLKLFMLLMLMQGACAPITIQLGGPSAPSPTIDPNPLTAPIATTTVAQAPHNDATASGINLIPSDIGSEYGLSSEQGKEVNQLARDANVRSFINSNSTKFISSNVFIFDSPVTDEISDLFATFEMQSRNASPNLTYTFEDILPASIGDRSGYRSYELQGGSWRGGTVIFVQSNCIVIIDYLTDSTDFSEVFIKSLAQKVSTLINSPRPVQIIPTATPLSMATISGSGASYTSGGIEFSNYTDATNTYRVDLPAQGCGNNQAGLTCDISSAVMGFLNVVSAPSNGTVIDDTNSLAMAQSSLEALKPLGMLTSYSNLTYQGNRNGMYAYCFNFEHLNLGSGDGCIGFETVGSNLFVIQFFTFNLGRDQVIWDVAYNSFEIIH